MDKGIPKEELLKDLLNLLLDSDKLEKLNAYFKKLNIFDVLKISDVEIRHSNFLAWLFDPVENHGLSDYFIKGFFNILVEQGLIEENHLSLKLLMMNYNNFIVRREWNNIDLLLISETEKVVVAIENKVKAKEHGEQLNKYKKIVDEEFKDYERFYIFLTVEGNSASDSDNWKSISYVDIYKLICRLLEDVNLPNDSTVFIKHYKTILERNIMEDEKIIKLCNEIYSKHKRALDLIFENKMDSQKSNYTYILKYLNNNENKVLDINFDESDATKTCIRFSTEFLERIFKPLPAEDNRSSAVWGSKKIAYYEINNYKDKIYITLGFSIKNTDGEPQDSELLKIAQSIYKKSTKKSDWDKRLNQKGCRIHKFNKEHRPTDSECDPESESTISLFLNEMFDKIAKFESDWSKELAKK